MTDDTEDKKQAAATEIYIKVSKDGPYLVFGKPEIRQEIIEPNEQGNSWSYLAGHFYEAREEPTALCRCGRSQNKPYCDGSHECDKKHACEPFDGTETAPKEPIMKKAVAYEGPHYTLYDNELYCAFARFCDAFGQVWNLVQDGRLEADQLALREAANCPAGRLMIKNNQTGEMVEPELKKSIGVLEDPTIRASGPLYVKGKIKIVSEDGSVYELRNRQTLCRCGASHNKPFCDGTHASMHFNDGLMEDKKEDTPRQRKAPGK